MNDDEAQIRGLIERWVAAVAAQDLPGVVADHTADVAAFPLVKPPYRWVQGLAGYEEMWPPFFAWLRSGGTIELETLEVTAGDGVAYAFGLLRSGTPDELAADPEDRLRLTVGLRREDGRWRIAHVHGSTADAVDGPVQ